MNIKFIYQEFISDHSNNPRNNFKILHPTHAAKGFNPVCGDKFEIFINIKNKTIYDISFIGNGCAISVASTSIMTDMIKHKSIKYASLITQKFHKVIYEDYKYNLGKLNVLKGVKNFPGRLKCATLSWHILQSIINIE